MKLKDFMYICETTGTSNVLQIRSSDICVGCVSDKKKIKMNREKIIQNYIDGYNEFDVEKMTYDFDNTIIFQNIQSGEVNMTLNGIDAFKQQAERTKSYFKNRQQKITSIKYNDDSIEIEVDYSATLATDFPNGLQKGDKLEMKGKSIFKFLDNKIVEITDIS